MRTVYRFKTYTYVRVGRDESRPTRTASRGSAWFPRSLSRGQGTRPTDFNWIHSLFYQYDSSLNKLIKRVPQYIGDYLTPLALAIWFMDDGTRFGYGYRFATARAAARA